MNQPIPIPDLRFESSFRRSLNAKAVSSSTKNKKKQNINTTDHTGDDEEEEDLTPIAITPLIVLQVVLKDVILMPLVQGIVWSSILLLAKPWLAIAAQHGRQVGVQLYHSLGFNVKRPVV